MEAREGINNPLRLSFEAQTRLFGNQEQQGMKSGSEVMKRCQQHSNLHMHTFQKQTKRSGDGLVFIS